MERKKKENVKCIEGIIKRNKEKKRNKVQIKERKSRNNHVFFLFLFSPRT